MIRGTTPTHIFTGIPFSSDETQEIWVTYSQNGKEVLNYDKSKIVWAQPKEGESTYTINIGLEQADTLKFVPGAASVQIRIVNTSNTALASQEMTFKVIRVLKGEQIGG